MSTVFYGLVLSPIVTCFVTITFYSFIYSFKGWQRVRIFLECLPLGDTFIRWCADGRRRRRGQNSTLVLERQGNSSLRVEPCDERETDRFGTTSVDALSLIRRPFASAFTRTYSPRSPPQVSNPSTSFSLSSPMWTRKRVGGRWKCRSRKCRSYNA